MAELAKRYNKPVIAFAGCVTEEACKCNEQGIDAFFPILRKAVTLEEVMIQTYLIGKSSMYPLVPIGSN